MARRRGARAARAAGRASSTHSAAAGTTRPEICMRRSPFSAASRMRAVAMSSARPIPALEGFSVDSRPPGYWKQNRIALGRRRRSSRRVVAPFRSARGPREIADPLRCEALRVAVTLLRDAREPPRCLSSRRSEWRLEGLALMQSVSCARQPLRKSGNREGLSVTYYLPEWVNPVIWL